LPRRFLYEEIPGTKEFRKYEAPAEFRVGDIPEDEAYYHELEKVGENKAFRQYLLRELFFIHQDVMMSDPNLPAEMQAVALGEFRERTRTIRKLIDLKFRIERESNAKSERISYESQSD
jgi:hypothetical protein